MNSLDEALARLKAAEAERDAACRDACEVVKAEYPAVVDAFVNMLVSDDDAIARWLGDKFADLRMTGFELIAGRRGSPAGTNRRRRLYLTTALRPRRSRRT